MKMKKKNRRNWQFLKIITLLMLVPVAVAYNRFDEIAMYRIQVENVLSFADVVYKK
jgi:uncharacterized membrane protein